MKYETHKTIAGRVVTLNGGAVASFSGDGAGDIAFGFFKSGVARQAGASLFERDTGKCLAGDIGQLDS